MLKLAGVSIELENKKQDYCGVKLAFGPKILIDPMFAITLKELQIKFAGKNKISKNASMILGESEIFFENLDLDDGTLVCKDGMKIPAGKVVFLPSEDEDQEIYRIRGYKCNI